MRVPSGTATLAPIAIAAWIALTPAVSFGQELSSHDYTARVEQGVQFYSSKEYSEAVATLEPLTESNPDNKEAFLWLGQAESRLENWDAALKAYQRYAELDPTDVQGLVGVAQAYEAQGKPDLALLWYRRALDVEPANAQLRSDVDRLQLPADAGTNTVAKPPQRPAPAPSDFWHVGLAGVLGARTVWWGRLLVLLVFVPGVLQGSYQQGKLTAERMPRVGGVGLALMVIVSTAIGYVLWWGLPAGWQWALLGGCAFIATSSAMYGFRQAQ